MSVDQQAAVDRARELTCDNVAISVEQRLEVRGARQRRQLGDVVGRRIGLCSAGATGSQSLAGSRPSSARSSAIVGNRSEKSSSTVASSHR